MVETSKTKFVGDFSICRILNGMWQVSGAHGPINPDTAVEAMLAYHEGLHYLGLSGPLWASGRVGLTTWDLADHYGPAEEFIGDFRRKLASSHGESSLDGVQAFTKWVPRPGPMTRQVVESNIGRSLHRMGVETIDLLQFHWWDYQDSSYLDALSHLSRMCDEGTIKHLGLTNFDTQHTRTVLDNGIKVVSNQVQFSIIDRRPDIQMVQMCQEHDVQLLAYGTLCGGLLSERYLDRPEPGRAELNTASLGKYKQMVDAWGGWELFQELLVVLKNIADEHGVSIPNVAVRYVLDRPAVAGVIIGVRLGVTDHTNDNLRAFDLVLAEGDHTRIQQVLERSRDLYASIGDCGDEYRR